MSGDIEELAQRVKQARRAVVFTGAGISTECGIPDFRSPGGLWTRFKPIAFKDYLGSPPLRREAWARFLMIRDALLAAEPGPSHRAVATLVEMGHASIVITQNIDGLHQRGGVADHKVIEIHGSGRHAACLTCGTHHGIDEVKEILAQGGDVPDCVQCGGIVKPATISFGQPLPEQVMADAKAATFNADLFLAIGSSLKVFPAAGLPVTAAHNRTPLVIINREPTGLDGLATQVIHAEIGDVLRGLMTLLESR